MNIFVLDYDPALAAQYHCDQHVGKMLLESVQILSTVSWKRGWPAPYKPTHKNHPCVLWAEENIDHWKWLETLAWRLSEEWRFRRGSSHQSSLALAKIKHIGKVPEAPKYFALCMPEEYKDFSDPVSSYRQFYIAEKKRFANWKWKRKEPYWWRCV